MLWQRVRRRREFQSGKLAQRAEEERDEWDFWKNRPDVNVWQHLGGAFEALADEERTFFLANPRSDRGLRAYCDYNSDRSTGEDELMQQGVVCLLYLPHAGRWLLSKGPNEYFKSRVEILMARAGTKLRHQVNLPPALNWIHEICLHLRKTKSADFFACSDTGGIITNLCQSSAMLCWAFERESLERVIPVAPDLLRIQGTADSSQQFLHSLDYRSVTLRGQSFTLTPRQSQIVQMLHEGQIHHHPDVSIDEILERIETQNSRWQDTFKTSREAKKALIISGSRRGTLRLNV